MALTVSFDETVMGAVGGVGGSESGRQREWAAARAVAVKTERSLEACWVELCNVAHVYRTLRKRESFEKSQAQKLSLCNKRLPGRIRIQRNS